MTELGKLTDRLLASDVVKLSCSFFAVSAGSVTILYKSGYIAETQSTK